MNTQEFNEQFLCTPEPTKQSELLTMFYRAYLAWVEDGAPNIPVFSRQHGLCHNLQTWVRHVKGIVAQDWYDANQEMRFQFAKANLHPTFPFNCGDRMYYMIEQGDNAVIPRCHSNTARLQWVRDHAE